MQHLEYAKRSLLPQLQDFIEVSQTDTAQTVSFTIQSAPVSEVGMNGIQVSNLIEYCWHLIFSLEQAHPCLENQLTLSYLSQAIDAQDLRTRNRETRGVEGKNEN